MIIEGEFYENRAKRQRSGYLMRSKLVIIESGSDASGKETQTQRLYERLVGDGHRVKG